MSFLHLSLAAIGSSFVAIPVLIHLLMRQKAKHFQFPALQFVQRREKVNQRRLQLRHLALLMLRCLAIGALAVALARPFVPSRLLANGLLVFILGAVGLALVLVGLLGISKTVGRAIPTGLVALGLLLCGAATLLGFQMQSGNSPMLAGDAQAPAAVAIVFDVSPRMSYQFQNQSRLEQAKELARWLLREISSDSEVAIVDTASNLAAFSVDHLAARSSIDGLKIAHQTTSLPEILRPAIDLVESSQNERKEIYVFTDMTQRSWRSTRDLELAERIASEPPLLVYLIDVSVERPTNLALGDLRLSAEYLTEGQPLRLEVSVGALGKGGEEELELLVEKPNPTRPVIVDGKALLPEMTLRSRQTVEVPLDGSAQKQFLLRGLSLGTHHGQVRMAGSDALNMDNQRFFSIEVMQPWPVLVTAHPNAIPDLMSALASDVFQCELVPFEKLAAIQFDQFAAVALLDPSPLTPEVWRGLAEFVSDGGGLGIFLGREAQPISAFNVGESQRLLPGHLSRQWRAPRNPFTIRLDQAPHPVIDTLRARATGIPWSDFPIYRHWSFDPLDDQTTSIVRLSNNQPLLIESTLGSGRVLTMTTPISDPLNVKGRPEWNLLPTGPDPWPYFVLVNDLFRYLVQGGETQLNYAVGEAATIATAGLGANQRLQIFQPQNTWQDVAASGDILTYRFTDTPGTFRLRNANMVSKQRGFSVNVPLAETDLQRVDNSTIDDLLGPGNYLVAKDRDQINRRIGEARHGRDFYPWILLLVAIVLGVEFLMANRFYVPLRPSAARS